MEGLERIVGDHRLFAGLGDAFIGLAAGCAKNVVFNPGQYIFRTEEAADWIYLIRHGRVALELAVPGRGAIQTETLDEGDIVGFNWLLPPYRCSTDARAIELTRAIAMDAKCLRDKCEVDHDLGYALMKRFLPVVVEHLQATRLQILDVYGPAR